MGGARSNDREEASDAGSTYMCCQDRCGIVYVLKYPRMNAATSGDAERLFMRYVTRSVHIPSIFSIKPIAINTRRLFQSSDKRLTMTGGPKLTQLAHVVRKRNTGVLRQYTAPSHALPLLQYPNPTAGMEECVATDKTITRLRRREHLQNQHGSEQQISTRKP